jgi:hypothetical protein
MGIPAAARPILTKLLRLTFSSESMILASNRNSKFGTGFRTSDGCRQLQNKTAFDEKAFQLFSIATTLESTFRIHRLSEFSMTIRQSLLRVKQGFILPPSQFSSDIADTICIFLIITLPQVVNHSFENSKGISIDTPDKTVTDSAITGGFHQ